MRLCHPMGVPLVHPKLMRSCTWWAYGTRSQRLSCNSSLPLRTWPSARPHGRTWGPTKTLWRSGQGYWTSCTWTRRTKSPWKAGLLGRTRPMRRQPARGYRVEAGRRQLAALRQSAPGLPKGIHNAMESVAQAERPWQYNAWYPSGTQGHPGPAWRAMGQFEPSGARPNTARLWDEKVIKNDHGQPIG